MTINALLVGFFIWVGSRSDVHDYLQHTMKYLLGVVGAMLLVASVVALCKRRRIGWAGIALAAVSLFFASLPLLSH
ncbi:MAG: hypothetical protein RLY20_3084 [Verrucomicrobiota bacterium]|jgi:hypothetical protein